MNELIILCLITVFIAVIWVGIQIAANICWVIHRIVYNGKMSRTQYVRWFNEIYVK